METKLLFLLSLGLCLCGAKCLIASRPFFELRPSSLATGESMRNVSTVEGGRAVFDCIVRNLGNRTVSWLRMGREPVVLSSGASVFTSDARVNVTRRWDSRMRRRIVWRLVIQPVVHTDQGLYQCQVNTRDKIGLVFRLNVNPASALIVGERDVFVKTDSTISLTCSINLFSVPAPTLTWFHHSTELRLDSPRGGISLESERTRFGTTSTLQVARAELRDSGNYTCKPSRGRAVSAHVHIIRDEHPAELQLDGKQQQQTSGGAKNALGPAKIVVLLLLIHSG